MQPRGFSTGEIAEAVGGRVRGDASLRLTGVAPLDTAGPQDLSFLHRPSHREVASRTRAGCVLVGSEDQLPGRTVVVVADPYRAFALAMRLAHPAVPQQAGVHGSAVVAATATIGEGAAIGPLAVVGEHAVIGRGAAVLAGAVVGDRCEVGEGSVLHPRAVLYPDTIVGRRCIVHAGAVLGADGFGYSSGADGHLKIPHVGKVVLEDDVEIGANSCVDRAVLGETRLGAGTKVDDLVMVAHNVAIGAESLLVAQSGVAGSAKLGRRVVLAGQSGVAGHIRLGDGVRVGAKSAVFGDVEDGETVTGIPALAHQRWRRMAVLLARLPELAQRIARLERSEAGLERSEAGLERRDGKAGSEDPA